MYIKTKVDVIDIEAAVNATEDTIKNEKVAMIEQIFDLKRQALRALESFKQQYAASLNAFVNASVTNVLHAVSSAQTGIVLSKTAVFNLTNAMTLENIQAVLADAQENAEEVVANAQEAVINATQQIGDALEDSAQLIQDTGNDVLASIVDIKQDLHDAAEEFDSHQAFHNGTVNLGVAINASIHGFQESVDNFGVFDALDDMVQTVVGGVPEKINSLILPIGNEEEVEKEVEEIPEIRDNQVVETHENFEPIEPKFFDNMFDMGSPVEEEVEEDKEVKEDDRNFGFGSVVRQKQVEDETIADEIRDMYEPVDPRSVQVEDELVVVPDVEVHVEPLMVDEMFERSDYEEEIEDETVDYEYQVVPRSFA